MRRLKNDADDYSPGGSHLKTSHLFVSVSAGLLALAGCLSFARHAAALPEPGSGPSHPAAAKKGLTYTKDIAPIIYNNCTSCHRAGEVAPFALQTYDDVRKHAQTIAAVTKSRYMPPWKADSHGEFVGERRLTSAQIQMIRDWMAAGAPHGDPADLPALPNFPKGWRLGAPNATYQPTESYTLDADGNDVYRCFVIPTHYDQDRYLSGIEIHPGNGKVVHHIIAYLDTSGSARALEAQEHLKDPKSPGYTSFGGPGFQPAGVLGGWVPGYDPVSLPKGVGIGLPKGSDIVLQVHYHKDGKPETDLSKVGLYFSKEPIDKEMRSLMLINPFFYLAPGEAHHEVKATLTVPDNITALDIVPHMHLIGHDMTVTAQMPDKTNMTLIDVPNWDFNWQSRYTYKQPVTMPKGTTLSLVAHYDNSTGNPRNPNSPPKDVTWGEQTTDEMCIAFIGYTVDAEHLTKGAGASDRAEFGAALAQGIAQELIDMYDKDGDGKLSVDEMTNLITQMQTRHTPGTGRLPATADPHKLAQMAITLCDKNGDKELDADEMAAALKMMRAFGQGHGTKQ
jgi:Ca2+-binding EF-hand superfamily protein